MGLREAMNSGKGRVILVVVAVVVIGAAGAYTVAKTTKNTGTGHGGSVGQQAYVCSACGNEWTAAPSVAPKCPKCGAAAATESWYRCPRCKKEFIGMYTKKTGPGKYEYRLAASDAKWASVPISEVVCPACSFKVTDFKATMIPKPGTEAVAERGRRVGD